MSYATQLADRAKDALRALEPWLQEDVLDEVDDLAAQPNRLVRRGRLPGFVHDFTQIKQGIVHYIFLVVDRDDVNEVLILNTRSRWQYKGGSGSR